MELEADCARCFGLCCVALPFAASADFAIDKDAGEPCRHLQDDFGCAIHSRLRQEGFPGCASFECHGAGQHISQGTFGGKDWRHHPGSAASMFAAFAVMRQLHELVRYVTEAVDRLPDGPVRRELLDLRETTEGLAAGTPAEVTDLDAGDLRRRVSGVLRRASEIVRADVPSRTDHAEADLAGADLRDADLRGTSFRAAWLMGADLRGADLRMCDLIGADLRGAELGGADLTGAIFLTQAQVDAAKGSRRTRLPDRLVCPGHW